MKKALFAFAVSLGGLLMSSVAAMAIMLRTISKHLVAGDAAFWITGVLVFPVTVYVAHTYPGLGFGVAAGVVALLIAELFVPSAPATSTPPTPASSAMVFEDPVMTWRGQTVYRHIQDQDGKRWVLTGLVSDTDPKDGDLIVNPGCIYKQIT